MITNFKLGDIVVKKNSRGVKHTFEITKLTEKSFQLTRPGLILSDMPIAGLEQDYKLYNEKKITCMTSNTSERYRHGN